MKTTKIVLESIKYSDLWCALAYELKFDEFKKEHEFLDEDTLNDCFYTEVISKYFEYGEYASIEIEIDENFKIVGGEIIKFKES